MIPDTLVGICAQDSPNSGPDPSFTFGTYHTIDNKRHHWGAMHTAAGTYDFSALDAVHSKWPNVKVVYVLYGTPTYLAQPGDQATPDAYGLLGGFSHPTNYTDMQAFLTALLPSRPWIVAVQIGNEMFDSGSTAFWNGTKPDGVDFAYYAIQTIKSVAPSVKCLNYGAFALTDFAAFLDATGTQCGVKGSALAFDGLALHPYFALPNLRTNETGMDLNTMSTPGGGIDHFTKAMVARGMPVLPVWITEYAPTSGTSGASLWRYTLFTSTYTAAQRRTWARRMYAAAARNPRIKSLASFSFISFSNLCGDMTEAGGYGAGVGDAQAMLAGKTLIAGAGYDASGTEIGSLTDGTSYTW